MHNLARENNVANSSGPLARSRKICAAIRFTIRVIGYVERPLALSRNGTWICGVRSQTSFRDG
jgi:hypothetical protein